MGRGWVGDRLVFSDRRAAGRRLGERLAEPYREADALALGLPRGGVPVAAEVAAVLDAELDVLLVRKLGAPSNPEFAVGAVAPGIVVYNDEAVATLGLDERDFEPIITRERAELERRDALYRKGRPPLFAEGRDVILVDDGIATGSTMHAAVLAARELGARRVTVAAPTASSDAVELLAQAADSVVVLAVPEPYVAVGRWYEDFPQLTDDEVVELLAEFAARRGKG